MVSNRAQGQCLISSTISLYFHQGFLLTLNDRGCFELGACVWVDGGLCSVEGNSTLGPLALGFNGDRTFRGGIETGSGGTSPPVTFRRKGGREAEDPGRPTPVSAGFSVVAANPEKGVVSAPNACRRAFSCLDWTDRKWRSSSCHLISSRPSLDRVERGPADDLGAICKKPAEFTAFSRFRSDTKAELCGSNISSPYKHLKR